MKCSDEYCAAAVLAEFDDAVFALVDSFQRERHWIVMRYDCVTRRGLDRNQRHPLWRPDKLRPNSEVLAVAVPSPDIVARILAS